MRPFYNFARVATSEVVPVLLQLLTKQDEDATDDEYNISRAAYQCLQLYAQAVGAGIIPPVIQFVEANLRHENWRNRDAAVSAFGAIMEGPGEQIMEPMVKQALGILINMMNDESLHVKDSTAYALGRITEFCSDAIDPNEHLPALVQALFQGLLSNPKMASSCCWALMNLAERFGGDDGKGSNHMTPHFHQSVTHLLNVTARPDCDSSLRTAAYEVLNSFVLYAASDSMPAVSSLMEVILKRLGETGPMQTQVVSVEDKITLEEMQVSLLTVLQTIISRLEKAIVPQGDIIMQLMLQMLSTSSAKSIVPESIFGVISALANAMEEEFVKYMEAFAPFLYNALGNQEEPSLCSVAIGLVSDITRSVGTASQPYCDTFMNYLLNNLRVRILPASPSALPSAHAKNLLANRSRVMLVCQSTTLGNQFKPAILQCFGDIASAIGGHFETYLPVVAQVLQQAAMVTSAPDGSYEMFDYVVSLREGIMDAWSGIIGAMKMSNKSKPQHSSLQDADGDRFLSNAFTAQLLQPHVTSIFELLNMIASDGNRSEPLIRSSMGVIGYVFPCPLTNPLYGIINVVANPPYRMIN